MNSGSAIAVVAVRNRASLTHLASWRFTDISMSPSGRYAFAADYGGENIGYGTPANVSYVHRIDLSNMTWAVRSAYIAGNIQTVSDTQVILKSLDQWVTFTNNAWGSGTALIPLNTPSSGPWGPGYYAAVFQGNIRYDVRTGRLLHGNSGESSQEIKAFRVIDNEFVGQEGSGVYGSAAGYGGTVVLATDGSAFYYGRLQVDALDVSHNTRVFPQLIYAANARVALADGTYYDAHTGTMLGSLPFSTTVYAMNPDGDDFWAYDPATTTVHHFASPCAPSASTLCLGGNRFQVAANWQSTTDSGEGIGVSLTPDTGYFWFFNSSNVEMVVKVLDACSLNSRKWVFAGGLTNVNVVLTVTDTQYGVVRTYVNPQSTAFQAVQDTGAFSTCP